MTRSCVSRSSVFIVGLVILVYASLATTAASCAFSHVDVFRGHAPHGSEEATPHNAFCAWACQATSDAWPATESLALSTGPVVRVVVSSPNQVIPLLSSSLLRSRAPPSDSFVLVG
jgi:hypothetical protein